MNKNPKEREVRFNTSATAAAVSTTTSLGFSIHAEVWYGAGEQI
jgi:hypothetical protein